MRVLIAGCWRSGTTAVYNLVRLILESDGKTLSCFEDEYINRKQEKNRHELLKAHKYRADEKKHGISLIDWADYIITIFRDPVEVMESMRVFFTEETEEQIQSRLLRGLSYWGKYQYYADYQINYDQLARCPEKLVREISVMLRINVDEKAIIREFDKIKPPKSGQDKKTLLYANHIRK